MVSIIEIIGLALVDAINPCALAVMVIVLMSLLMENPEKRKQVLLGGFAFTLAVFLLYFLYGLLMIKIFSSAIPSTGKYSLYIFKGFGLFAIILGILNLKDSMFYKPGGFATEMPLRLRPRMKLLIKKVTSPWGAFVIGIFVTLFLLPCTIGPYIIASGQLSQLTILETIPWLLIYNLIFILPMIGVTLAIYLSFTTVDKVSGWKEKNIKYLHLVEGLILVILGILMFTGILA
ncbi:MAG: GAP family protein [Candidatus Pacearchaeota archaeon]